MTRYSSMLNFFHDGKLPICFLPAYLKFKVKDKGPRQFEVSIMLSCGVQSIDLVRRSTTQNCCSRNNFAYVVPDPHSVLRYAKSSDMSIHTVAEGLSSTGSDGQESAESAAVTTVVWVDATASMGAALSLA